MSEGELKPCPFCQGLEFFCSQNTANNFSIVCVTCGTDGKAAKTKEKAIDAWNTRPLEDALQSQLKAAQEEIERLKGLDYIVQFTRKDAGGWHNMAAFDSESIAQKYATKCGRGDPPWEYRVIVNSKG
jgi:Lar family restriction alleviation protein